MKTRYYYPRLFCGGKRRSVIKNTLPYVPEIIRIEDFKGDGCFIPPHDVLVILDLIKRIKTEEHAESLPGNIRIFGKQMLRDNYKTSYCKKHKRSFSDEVALTKKVNALIEYSILEFTAEETDKAGARKIYYYSIYPELLGNGKFAEVFVIQDLQTHALAALKKQIINDGDKMTLAQVEMEQEIMVRAGDSPRSQISVRQSHSKEPIKRGKSQVPMVMGLAHGISLKEFLQREDAWFNHCAADVYVGIMPPLTRIETAIQMIDAVIKFHELGYLHCDLSIGNFMIDQRGRAKLVDFGYARPMNANGVYESDEPLGTALHMNAQLRARLKKYLQGEKLSFEYSKKSDLYALIIAISYLFNFLDYPPERIMDWEDKSYIVAKNSNLFIFNDTIPAKERLQLLELFHRMADFGGGQTNPAINLYQLKAEFVAIKDALIPKEECQLKVGILDVNDYLQADQLATIRLVQAEFHHLVLIDSGRVKRGKNVYLQVQRDFEFTGFRTDPATGELTIERKGIPVLEAYFTGQNQVAAMDAAMKYVQKLHPANRAIPAYCCEFVELDEEKPDKASLGVKAMM